MRERLIWSEVQVCLPTTPPTVEILVLLVVFDRRSRGRAKLAILDQDWKASPLVEHELKMFDYRWAARAPDAQTEKQPPDPG
jgi:hypothetical protein